MKNILILVLVLLISACTHPVDVGPNATNLTVGKVQGEIKEGMSASSVAIILEDCDFFLKIHYTFKLKSGGAIEKFFLFLVEFN